MYNGKTFNRETVYICGDYMDGAIYPIFQRPGMRRAKCRPTSDIQARLNQRNAEKKLTRLIHNNFTSEDLALHLTYRGGSEPMSEEDAQRILGNFTRRLKRRYKKLGLELKYISCTEYGSHGGRCHHHLIINGGLDRDTIEKLWGRGYANSKRLQFEEDGVAGLTHYIAKDKHFYKRWNRSRNLDIPEPAQYDARLSMENVEELQEAIESKNAHQLFEEKYPDFELVEANYIKNSVNRGIYIQFEMRRRC